MSDRPAVATTFDDDAVNGTDFVWVDDQFVADADVRQLYFCNQTVDASMRDQRHSTGERLQD